MLLPIMHLRFSLLIVALLSALNGSAQIHFLNRTDLLTPAAHYSGIPVGVADMNGDGRDDIIRLDQSRLFSIEFQTAPDAPFRHLTVAQAFSQPQWGMCVADLDNNGKPDILTAGNLDGVKILLANADASAYQLVQYPNFEAFAQAVNFADINQDGWLDAFVCHDEGTSLVLLNVGDAQGSLVHAPQAMPLATVPPSDDSGNYGSVWSDVDNDGDLDLYISKCKGGVTDPGDGRRINQLFWNNGDGTYEQDTTNASGLRIGAQSWSSDFGDIDNDGDMDVFVINHYDPSQLLENDGTGHFTDISSSALMTSIEGFGLQVVFRDFDNDGFVDILIGGSSHYLLRNNGDKTFSLVPVLGADQVRTFAVGDLNGDGFLDIYAGYAFFAQNADTPPDALWLNAGNDNHFFGLTLRGADHNSNAVGAKVWLHSALGTQVREVRAGESYGIMNSMQIHFGMGQVTQIDSVVVRWPSGNTDVLHAPAVDQYLVLEEGGCSVSPVRVAAQGGTVFCSGDSVLIQPLQTYSAYHWSSGEQTATIAAKTSGWYEVTVTTAEGCTAVSNAVLVTVDPIEIPTITAWGDTVICVGDTVLLAASSAPAYWWSTGETTPTVAVAQSGTYTVQTQGLCDLFVSAPMTVTVLEPELPTVMPDTVGIGASALLTATGDEPFWYDAPTGGALVATGNTLATPPLTETTTFWVANNDLFSTPSYAVGMTDHQGSTLFPGQQTDGWLVLDCWTPVRLLRTKVYTDLAGERKIVLRRADGTVLQSTVVHIPEGTSVIDLNLDIPVGTNLRLTTDTAVNRQNFGFISPQLGRSTEGVQFPYTVPGYLSIKSSSLGVLRYFYFYDWEIKPADYYCLSDRVPVQAVVDSTIIAAPILPDAETLRIYPNPTSGHLLLAWAQFPGGDLRLTLRNTLGTAVWSEVLRNLPQGSLEQPLHLGDLPSGGYWLELATREGVVYRSVAVAR